MQGYCRRNWLLEHSSSTVVGLGSRASARFPVSDQAVLVLLEPLLAECTALPSHTGSEKGFPDQDTDVSISRIGGIQAFFHRI